MAAKNDDERAEWRDLIGRGSKMRGNGGRPSMAETGTGRLCWGGQGRPRRGQRGDEKEGGQGWPLRGQRGTIKRAAKDGRSGDREGTRKRVAKDGRHIDTEGAMASRQAGQQRGYLRSERASRSMSAMGWQLSLRSMLWPVSGV